MLRNLRSEFRRPTFWIACAALMVAVGGQAAAAGWIGTEQIENGGVRSIDIGLGQVSSKHLRNGNVRAIDIATGGVTASRIRAGAVTSNKVRDRAIQMRHFADDVQFGSGNIAEASITSTQLASGAVAPDALDPRLARIYQFGRTLAPGAADVTVFELKGYRLSLGCDDAGGGNRVARLRLARPDGASDWGIGGSMTYLFRTDLGANFEPVALTGLASYELPIPSTLTPTQTFDLFVGRADGSEGGLLLRIIASNTNGGAATCGAYGTASPFTADA